MYIFSTPELQAVWQAASFYYIGGFFFTVSQESIMTVARHAHENGTSYLTKQHSSLNNTMQHTAPYPCALFELSLGTLRCIHSSSFTQSFCIYKFYTSSVGSLISTLSFSLTCMIGKTLAINLSAPFIPQFFGAGIAEVTLITMITLISPSSTSLSVSLSHDLLMISRVHVLDDWIVSIGHALRRYCHW